MAKYPDRRSAALPALAAGQRLHGWCSPEAIEQVACVMRVTPGYLSAVATFYDMLDTEPVGAHRVYVCTNISCSLNGADRLYERRGGYQSLRKALGMSHEDVLHELMTSNIRGRGGAGFQMGKKASFLPEGPMQKYLCCNADESEPGTFKDREIMQKNPHMLI